MLVVALLEDNGGIMGSNTNNNTCCSAVSSGVNALAAVVLVDMIQPTYLYMQGTPLKVKTAGLLSKLICKYFNCNNPNMIFHSLSKEWHPLKYNFWTTKLK